MFGQVVMVTGDHPDTARAIAGKLQSVKRVQERSWRAIVDAKPALEAASTSLALLLTAPTRSVTGRLFFMAFVLVCMVFGVRLSSSRERTSL